MVEKKEEHLIWSYADIHPLTLLEYLVLQTEKEEKKEMKKNICKVKCQNNKDFYPIHIPNQTNQKKKKKKVEYREFSQKKKCAQTFK